MSLHSNRHTYRVRVCLAITCHLHIWQNDRDLLRATVVTLGWNGYRNKSQQRKFAPEKKFLPPLLPGLEPETFWSRVRRSTTELSQLPFSFLTSSIFQITIKVVGDCQTDLCHNLTRKEACIPVSVAVPLSRNITIRSSVCRLPGWGVQVTVRTEAGRLRSSSDTSILCLHPARTHSLGQFF